MNATKLRDQLDALLDKLADKIETEAYEDAEQCNADFAYRALAKRLHSLVAEHRDPAVTDNDRPGTEFLDGFAYALDVLMEALPPSDDAREADPLPELPTA